MILRLFFLLIALGTPLFAEIEDSITALMNQNHSIKNIEPKKYSKNQYKVISEALFQKEHIIRIVSYQMLVDRYDALLPPHLRWPQRYPKIVQLIQEMNADIICCQQLYPNQVTNLLETMGKEYEFLGNLPGEDEEPSEVNGIFYRKSRFQCQEARACTIPETTQVLGSESRTFTEVHLLDWITGKELAIISAHAPFGSPDAREYMAHFLVEHTELICKKKATILAGNFNTFAPKVDDYLLPYYDGNYIFKILTSKSLRDAHDTALIGTLGPMATYTNREGSPLPFQGTGTPGVFLDHILVGGNILVLLQAVQPALVDGHFPSDHMPLVVDCVNFQSAH